MKASIKPDRLQTCAQGPFFASQHLRMFCLVETGRLKMSEVSEPRGPLNRARNFLKLQPFKIPWGIVLDCPLLRTVPFSSFLPSIARHPQDFSISSLRRWYRTFHIQNLPSISLTTLETGRCRTRTVCMHPHLFIEQRLIPGATQSFVILSFHRC